MRALPLLVTAASLLPAAPLFAQQGAPATAAPADPTGDIVVTASHRRSDDILGDVSVLGGDALASALRPTIGETLAQQPGVAIAGSGPNVAKPVLRGLAGERIRVLTDGIGSLDVAASSADHAVAINPLTADSIEVLHGPAALVYGSSAIGGVVNVIDSRIPRRSPDNGAAASALAGYGSAARQWLANGEIDAALSTHLVAHVDANWTHSKDLDTGGYILARPLRDEAALSADPDIRALADLKGRLPNSAGKSFEAAAALAYVDGPLNVGASLTRHTALYGVPIRYSLDPAVEAEAPRIDVEQTRFDARAEVPLEGAFRQVKLRGGFSDYRHAEVEEDGSVASMIFSKGGEVRADLVQRDTATNWGGSTGVQLLRLNQRIDGDEAYLPPVRRTDAALYTLQHFGHGPWRIEAGARLEHRALSAEAFAPTGNDALKRRFTTVSASLGANRDIADHWSFGFNVARSARAPAADELFANGPHAGNASFEIGDPSLGAERSLGTEVNIRRKGRLFDLHASLYANRFASFIYQAPTGEIEDDLPVYQARQGRARQFGIEAEARAPLGTALGIAWHGELLGDYNRVTIRGFGPAPQIPPLRLLGALEGKRGPLSGRLEVERVSAQNRIALNETRTDGFTLVNLGLEWQPLADRDDFVLAFNAENIFDVEARRHSSLLKDYAPMAGRDLRVNARLAF